MISHQSYFEFLASADQDALTWQPVVAGLGVLRLVDSRISGDTRDASDWASLESVRSTAAALNEGNPVRAILLQLVEDVSKEEIQREAVGRGLIAYGRALNFEGRWALACDVFATADSLAGAPGNPRVSVESNIALGAAARRMGDFETSAHAYARASHVANAVGDVAGAMQVEVGRAATHMVRGNLPAAEALLAEVIEQARSAKSSHVLGLALHARASVLHQKGEYAEAVRVGYEALEEMSDSPSRDGVLSDIAASLAGMGLRDAARDGYLIVSATSQSQWIRWQADLNLMELAALDGNEVEFEAYARQMETAPLDPRLRAHYFLFHGAGQQKFGKEAEAEESLSKGLAFAEANQLHQLAYEASAAIAELKSHKTPLREVVAQPLDIDQSLRWIVSELSGLREAAMSSP